MRQRVTRCVTAILVLVFAAGVLAATQTETVYVTKTGAKYHRAGCSSLRLSSIAMPLAQAAQRYSPCKICKPPVLEVGGIATASRAASSSKPAATQAVEAGRCQAITKKGTRCSRKAKAGSKYCWQHGGVQ